MACVRLNYYVRIVLVLRLVCNRYMSQSALETFKTKAANSVLGTLGEPLLSVLKDHLQRDHKIMLYDDAFTLEELQIALQRILGANPSDLIIREIRFQIEELSKAYLR